MNEQQTSMAEEIRKRSFLVRTEEQLRDALSRFCRGDVCMSIPVDYERDADMILSDGIKELVALRKATAADPEATITEERLKEIEEQARGIFPPPPKGYQAAGGLVVMAAIEDGKRTALAAVPDLVSEIHRLRAKVQEQESTIAGLREELAEPIPEF